MLLQLKTNNIDEHIKKKMQKNKYHATAHCSTYFTPCSIQMNANKMAQLVGSFNFFSCIFKCGMKLKMKTVGGLRLIA